MSDYPLSDYLRRRLSASPIIRHPTVWLFNLICASNYPRRFSSARRPQIIGHLLYVQRLNYLASKLSTIWVLSLTIRLVIRSVKDNGRYIQPLVSIWSRFCNAPCRDNMSRFVKVSGLSKLINMTSWNIVCEYVHCRYRTVPPPIFNTTAHF